MRKLIRFIFIIFVFLTGILFANYLKTFYPNIKSPITKTAEKVEKPLEKYTIENLQKSNIKEGKFEISQILKEEEKYRSYIFSFAFNPDLDTKKTKITTGQINIPIEGLQSSKTTFPIIIMFRGYINQEIYKTGDGTRNAANYFAENGFITIAPDFLGYGGSDTEANNIFESRFQTYITAASLLKSINLISNDLNLLKVSASIPDSNRIVNYFYNHSDIFIWGHSNGGQIAVTTLEITGA